MSVYPPVSGSHRDEFDSKWLLPAVLLGALWLALAPASASATVVRHASLETLVEVSDRIVRARVESRRSFFDDDQDRILTHTQLAVSRSYLAGSRDSSGRLVIEQWGGTVGERSRVIPGDASFEVGEEVLVFLRSIPDRDVFALAALAQSKYSLQERDGVLWAKRDLSELVFAQPSADDSDSPGDLLRIDGIPRRFPVLEERLLELIAVAEDIENQPPAPNSGGVR